MPLLDAIAAASIARITEYNPQSIGNSVWAYAKLGITYVPVLNAISAPSLRKFHELIPQELANIAWSLATLQKEDVPLLDAISSEAIKKINHFATQNLSNTVWAYATLGVGNPEMLNSLGAGPAAASLDEDPAVSPDCDFSASEIASALEVEGFCLAPVEVCVGSRGVADVASTVQNAFAPVDRARGIVKGVLVHKPGRYLACLRNGSQITWIDVLRSGQGGQLSDVEFVDLLQAYESFRVLRKTAPSD
eukprot:gnl/MRDRNA2_/MRDRNA2_85114_c0_seq1.p1 gnl/MRDRNA2_/MRDRNA2_85114_c0~~gnl/MRDRNA2_/MRDRNA2_85114_c0_seq1.p1  ORF type:complete len:249 (+),score=38.31 gnl/MRDRNA2_/MRDRNA2_85114_c0_seq1:256-1002(+)